MFKTIPLLRGFSEITKIYDIATANDGIICGGYARYCASPRKDPKPAADVDIFPKTVTATNAILGKLLELGFVREHENPMSITLKAPLDRDDLKYMPIPQIIKPVVQGAIVATGTTEVILSNFDFSVVRAAIISPTEVMVDEDFEYDEKHNYLRLKNIHCPVSSLLRCCKYASKGYFMRPSEALKLFKDWTNRDLEYRRKLIALFDKSTLGLQSDDNINGLTQRDINELEALLRID